MNYHKQYKNRFIIHHIKYCLIVSIAMMCCAMTCGLEEFRQIYVVNKCNETIYVNYIEGSDELLNPSYIHFKGFNEDNKILPGETLAIEVMEINDSFKYIYYQFLIHKQSTLDNYSIDEIKELEIFDERYIFTRDELEHRNFLIEYPTNK